MTGVEGVEPDMKGTYRIIDWRTPNTRWSKNDFKTRRTRPDRSTCSWATGRPSSWTSPA